MLTLARKAKLRVALVVPSLCHGGAERQIMAMARYLDPNKFETYLITFSDYTPLLDSADPLRDRHIIIQKKFRFDLSLFWRLYTTLRRLRVDIVHSFHFDAEIVSRLVGRLAGARYVVGSERNCDYKISRWRWLLNWLTLPRTDLIVANSRSGARFHQELYRGRQKHYAVVYNGVDTERFNRADKPAAKQALGYDSTDIVIGMFASFKPQKNHINLILALENLIQNNPSIKLLLAGDILVYNYANTDKYKATVLEKMKDTGVLAVTNMLGNQVDLPPIYNACDFTVLPSLHEGTPNVVLESMACGVPVVLTDVADNSLLVEDGVDGLLVEPDNVDDLRDKISMMCDDEGLRSGLALAARKAAVARMSNERMGLALEQTYAAMLGDDSIA